MDPPLAKKRRYAKACDWCFKKKVKRRWQPPSCPACAKSGNACIFTRAERNAPKARHETRSLEAVHDRLKVVEGLLYGLTDRESSAKISSSTTTDLPNTTVPNQAHIGDLLSSSFESIGEIIRYYFKQINHYFPVFDHKVFVQSIQDHKPDAKSDPVWWATLNVTMSLSHFCNTWSGDFGSVEGQSTADACLQNAMAVVGQIMLLEPTLSCVQALVSIASCLHNSRVNTGHTTASVLIAAAVRMAHHLRLHQLNTVTNLTVAERMERMRVFWCLYILDKEQSLATFQPSLLDDDDLFVLNPRILSDDSVGLVASDDLNKVLNLFTARQRLAEIAGLIAKGLGSIKAQHQPVSKREEVVALLNNRLVNWKAEFFNYGASKGLMDHWSKAVVLHMITLHFTYFKCLLRTNQDVPSDPEGIENAIQALRSSGSDRALCLKRSTCPTGCAQAARDTLVFAETLRRGSSVSSKEVHQVIPALLVFIWYTSTLSHDRRLPEDRLLVQGWMDLLAELCHQDDNGAFQAALHACKSLRDFELPENDDSIVTDSLHA